MNIVIFTHPGFLGSQSMPRYARMLAEGMEARNHTVEIWTCREYFYRLPFFGLKKWLGYLDQFLLFPIEVKRKIRKCPPHTLFVFSDQALGPWVNLVSGRPKIVHCHDFLAQRSAMGEIPENKVNLTGKIYQKMIRTGYRRGTSFISISEKTREDLHRFLHKSPRLSTVVYNGLNQDFKPGKALEARDLLESELGINLGGGFILHVGGNQFYKNRKGVIEIYNAWRKTEKGTLPILMIGAQPTEELRRYRENSGFPTDIHFLTNISDELLRVAYQGAEVFLFPSLEEGFGWPIAEAMASGCPVITTDRAPMNEVGNNSCVYIPARPSGTGFTNQWSENCARILQKVLELPGEERKNLIQAGLKNAERFDTQKALHKIESVYKSVLKAEMA